MDPEFLDELFAPFGKVSIRKMFGGTGIFHRGLNFAGIMDGQFRLKADEQTQGAFMAEGMTPWQYTRGNGKTVVMSYWSVPERLLDDPEEFKNWAQAAFEAAMRADQKKSPSQRKLQNF
ncbi:MAG: TfoX/Sxy family protein [Rhizobiaceae bacterium]